MVDRESEMGYVGDIPPGGCRASLILCQNPSRGPLLVFLPSVIHGGFDGLRRGRISQQATPRASGSALRRNVIRVDRGRRLKVLRIEIYESS